MKLHPTTALYFFFPSPWVIEYLVSPSGTYSNFPKVNYSRIVEHRELVWTTTFHCFTFQVWKAYQGHYSMLPTYNILRNLVCTFLARDIANLPRSHVYDCIMEEDGTLIWRNHISWSIANLRLKILHSVQNKFIFTL